jgi:branched-chain amino acid transport system substrate-binding protein
VSHGKGKFLRSAALLTAGAMTFAACGSDKEETPSATTTAGGTATTAGQTQTVKIGFISPLSGSLSALGIGMKNSVDLAIKQANAAGTIKGWKIELAAEDDTAKADVGAQVATKLASDPAVGGVVGTLNSSVALQVQPILNTANIAMISPANTGVALTFGADAANKKRPYASYFRVAANDGIQGPFGADYASKDAASKTVVAIHDKKAYGQGLVEAFKARFEKNGGKVAAVETINPGDQDFSAVITKIKPLNPDLIYYGGEYPEAGPLSNQLKKAGIKAPLMGGDGIYDPKFVELATAASAEGDLSTSVGAPPEKLASAKAYLDAYKAGGYSDPFGGYGPQAYDSANAIINAMAKVLPGKTSLDSATRKAIVDAIQANTFDGATGKVGFDAFGDTITPVLTAYKVTGGKWVDVKTEAFK